METAVPNRLGSCCSIVRADARSGLGVHGAGRRQSGLAYHRILNPVVFLRIEDPIPNEGVKPIVFAK